MKAYLFLFVSNKTQPSFFMNSICKIYICNVNFIKWLCLSKLVVKFNYGKCCLRRRFSWKNFKKSKKYFFCLCIIWTLKVSWICPPNRFLFQYLSIDKQFDGHRPQLWTQNLQTQFYWKSFSESVYLHILKPFKLMTFYFFCKLN